MPKKNKSLTTTRFSVEIETEFPNTEDSSELITKHRVIPGWEMDYDGTLENGAEYRPKKKNKLYFNKDSLMQIKEVLALIKVHKGHIRPSCFTSRTKILMSDYTQKDINKVKVGDKIIALDLKDNKFKESEVLEIFKGKRETIKILDENNNLIFNCTPDHPVLYKIPGQNVLEHFNAFAPIELVSNLFKIYNYKFKVKHEEDWYNGWLAGILDGDGWFIKSYDKNSFIGFGIGSIDIEILNMVNICLQKRGLNSINIKQRQRGNNKLFYYGTIAGEEIRNLLFQLYKLVDKRPSNAFMRGYLAGFFDAEGNIDKKRGRCQFTNTDELLKNRVTAFLTKLNYDFFVLNKAKTIKNKTIYRIITKDSIKFYTECHPCLIRKYPLWTSLFNQVNRINIKHEYAGINKIYNLRTSLGTYIANGIVVHNCGCHVHVDMSGFSYKEQVNIVKAFVRQQNKIIKKFKVLKFRLDNTAQKIPLSVLKEISEYEMQKVKKSMSFGDGYFSDRHYLLNIQSLNKHNTFEFRLFGGSVEFKKIKENVKWAIEFCLKNSKTEIS